MAQNCGRCRARGAQGCLRASGRLWPRAQTIAAVLSGDSLGQNQTGPIQFAPGQIAVFFIDDNFAINVKRTKSLLRDIIAANAQVHWVAQISANLLRDEELVDLIAAAGGKWNFIGMESIDPANLADVKKGFKKPG